MNTRTNTVESASQRFYRGFARLHHRLMVHTRGRPPWLTPRLRVLVLTTLGHRSGEPRHATLAYLPDGDDYIVLATNFGRDHHPGWYHNLQAHPRATITIAGHAMAVVATTLSGPERERTLERATRHNAQWRSYQTHTHRQIPVVRLAPDPEPAT